MRDPARGVTYARRVSIYLIRHGETAGNAARIFQVPETPLSERGEHQAARVAQRLADVGIAHILASDLERAHMTARAVAESTGAPVELDSLLHERNFGDLRGTPYAELSVDPFGADFVPPAGESWDVFHDRVAQAWGRVVALAPRVTGHLAVVTHGLVCRAIIQRHARTPRAYVDDARGFGNTSVTLIGSAAPFEVELLACTEHLDEAAPDGAPV